MANLRADLLKRFKDLEAKAKAKMPTGSDLINFGDRNLGLTFENAYEQKKWVQYLCARTTSTSAEQDKFLHYVACRVAQAEADLEDDEHRETRSSASNPTHVQTDPTVMEGLTEMEALTIRMGNVVKIHDMLRNENRIALLEMQVQQMMDIIAELKLGGR